MSDVIRGREETYSAPILRRLYEEAQEDLREVRQALEGERTKSANLERLLATATEERDQAVNNIVTERTRASHKQLVMSALLDATEYERNLYKKALRDLSATCYEAAEALDRWKQISEGRVRK